MLALLYIYANRGSGSNVLLSDLELLLSTFSSAIPLELIEPASFPAHLVLKFVEAVAFISDKLVGEKVLVADELAKQVEPVLKKVPDFLFKELLLHQDSFTGRLLKESLQKPVNLYITSSLQELWEQKLAKLNWSCFFTDDNFSFEQVQSSVLMGWVLGPVLDKLFVAYATKQIEEGLFLSILMSSQHFYENKFTFAKGVFRCVHSYTFKSSEDPQSFSHSCAFLNCH